MAAAGALAALWACAAAAGLAAASESPRGCAPGLNPVYFGLCDLRAAWGVVLETLAAAGLLATGLLAVAFAALTTARGGRGRRERPSGLAVRLLVLAGASGLFALVFAFVVGPHPANCVARRFLFGALFALCFGSLASQAASLARQARAGGKALGGRAALLLALGLFLLECLVNGEWLLATVTRGRPLEPRPGQNPCRIAKQDFVSALVYVMALLAAALVLAALGLRSPRPRAKRRAAYILAASCLSAGLWVAWVAAYLSGERRPREPGWGRGRALDAWDDPPLALILVANAWVLVFCYLLPEMLEMCRDGEEEQEEEETEWRGGGGRPEKSRSQQSYVENKAFDPEDGQGKYIQSPDQDGKQPSSLNKETTGLEANPRLSTISDAPENFLYPWPETAQYRTHFS